MVDFAFADLLPNYVITGLAPADFLTHVHAGMFVGWLHRPVGLVALLEPPVRQQQVIPDLGDPPIDALSFGAAGFSLILGSATGSKKGPR